MFDDAPEWTAPMETPHRCLRRHLCVYAFLMFFLWGGWNAFVPASDPPLPSSETRHFIVIGTSPDIRNLQEWSSFCENALDRLVPDSDRLYGEMRPKVLVQASWGGKDFERLSGMSASSTAAVAMLSENRIVLNINALSDLTRSERFRVIGHEMVHLLLDRVADNKAHVPYWLHEGLAQELTGQSDFGGAVRLAWAGLIGRRIPMRRLSSTFPYGTPEANLAYAQSVSFTRYVMEQRLGYPDCRSGFEAWVKNPDRARSLFKQLSNPDEADLLEIGWSRKGGWMSRTILVASGGTLLWGAITALFLYAYFRRKRHERKIMDDWDEWERDPEP
jgi:hypothetical protein